MKHTEAQSRVTKHEKPVFDGMWDTLVTKSSKEDLNKYFENSVISMNKAVPNIVKKKVLESEKSESNRIMSVRVLYEGGLASKRNYNAIRRCPIEIMKDCTEHITLQNSFEVYSLKIPPGKDQG